jgi:hypothetical protein
MKRLLASACIFLCTVGFHGYAQQQGDPTAASKVQVTTSEKTLVSQWQGKRVAFLGDSMTDTHRIGTTCVYWEYLSELLGIEPVVYGISGNQWDGIYKQALKLHEQKGNE